MFPLRLCLLSKPRLSRDMCFWEPLRIEKTGTHDPLLLCLFKKQIAPLHNCKGAELCCLSFIKTSTAICACSSALCLCLKSTVCHHMIARREPLFFLSYASPKGIQRAAHNLLLPSLCSKFYTYPLWLRECEPLYCLYFTQNPCSFSHDPLLLYLCSKTTLQPTGDCKCASLCLISFTQK
jgi:hypothetical protein